MRVTFDGLNPVPWKLIVIPVLLVCPGWASVTWADCDPAATEAARGFLEALEGGDDTSDYFQAVDLPPDSGVDGEEPMAEFPMGQVSFEVAACSTFRDSPLSSIELPGNPDLAITVVAHIRPTIDEGPPRCWGLIVQPFTGSTPWLVTIVVPLRSQECLPAVEQPRAAGGTNDGR